MASELSKEREAIAALEAKASRSPRAYRFWLTLIAIAGDFALTLVHVFPIVATIVIGVALYPQLFWPGVAGIVFFVWLFRPTLRFRGRELTEKAPRLEEELATLKQKLRVPGRLRVYLEESLNAGAMQTRGVFGLIGTRCALILGVPLLLALSREQMLAVLAHEFGHFSRRHGLLGQWLYRARVGWLEYARQVRQSDSMFDVAAARYAESFVPFFSARSFVESRLCEYEADADAVFATGGRAFAGALTRVAVVGRFWEKELPRQMRAWQLQFPEPPADFLERFSRGLSQCSASQLEAWLDETMREPSTWVDTHPCLSDRLRAANEQPVLVPAATSAGEALLGALWPVVLAEFNDQWSREARHDWLARHLWLKHIAQPLLDAGEQTARGWDREQRLVRANVLRDIDSAAGMAALRDLYEAEPQHKRIRFAYAAALLEEDNEEGVEIMRILAREDPTFRLRVFERVLAHYEKQGNTRQTGRWSAWLKEFAPRIGEAMTSFVNDVELRQRRVGTLAAVNRTVLSETARLDPTVAGAWLVEGQATLKYADDRPPVMVVGHLFAVAVDVEQMKRAQQDEVSIRQRYEELLRTLLPPDQLTVVRTFFISEGRPEIYAPNSEFALFATDETRLKRTVGFEKNDW